MSYRYSNAKYMTIAEHIARRLRAGEFLGGEPFYSRDELARAYHISPGTARAVLRVLEDRGIIACRKGKRPIPVGVIPGIQAHPVCRPVFFRDPYTAETPEYDYLAYCARNILMRQETELGEQDPEEGMLPPLSDRDVAVFFPSAKNTDNPADQSISGRPAFRPASGCIDLLIDQTGSNAMAVFTRKANLDCELNLIQHNIASVIHVASKHSVFPWFRRISAPGMLSEYVPGCEAFNLVFDDELERFPEYLTESVPAAATPGHAPVAVLIDDPYLSDYLSGEIRIGTYHPPSWYSFFGTAFNERSMVFPYLDLKLDVLAASLIRTVCSKAENPSANLACDFHLIQFRNPGIG